MNALPTKPHPRPRARQEPTRPARTFLRPAPSPPHSPASIPLPTPLPETLHATRHPAFSLLATLLLLLTLIPSASAITVSASLDADTIRLGEATTINVTCNGGRPRSLPRLTAVDGLQFGYAGESSQTTIINGQISQSFTYAFRVQPQKEGRFVIPPIQVDLGGQIVPTGPLTLTVQAANSRSPEANPLAKYAFMHLVVPTTNVFVGEVFPVEMKLYFLAGQNLQIPQAIGDGFRFTILRPISSQGREQFGNNLYNVISFRTGAIATRTGNVPLTFETELTLILYQGNIFGERRPVKINSDSVTMNVAPLPSANVPASFNGAVGSFNLTMQATPATLAVGDPLAIRIQIAGRGELDALQLPPINVWREFKTYPPTSKVELADQIGLQGVKNFEIVALPENAEIKELAPLEFTFFDPQQRAYRTLYTPKFPLTVRPTTVTAQQPTIVTATATNQNSAAPPPPPPPQDIVHIKSRPGTLAVATPPLLARPAFLALQSVPFVLWIALLLRRRHADNLANNPRRQRTLQTAHLIKSGLQQARAQAEQNQTQDFFATVFRLLQEQIGERLDQPATAITEDIIESRLRPLGASEQLLKTLHELFQACNQARYAPQGTRETMAALLPRIESALRDLKQLRPA